MKTSAGFFRPFALVVAGIVVGLAVGGQPVQAGKAGKLAARVTQLEQRLAALETKTADVEYRAGQRLDHLELLTQLLDDEGTYYGFVNAVQVWSHYCSRSDDAVWGEFEGYTELSCTPSRSTGRITQRSSVRSQGTARAVRHGSPLRVPNRT